MRVVGGGVQVAYPLPTHCLQLPDDVLSVHNWQQTVRAAVWGHIRGNWLVPHCSTQDVRRGLDLQYAPLRHDPLQGGPVGRLGDALASLLQSPGRPVEAFLGECGAGLNCGLDLGAEVIPRGDGRAGGAHARSVRA